MHALALLALLAPLQLPIAREEMRPLAPDRNILVVMVDDVGRDLLSAYGDEGERACTPAIDSLAERGMLFRNAWSNPICSPSRAQILTGRYAYRTGVGSNAGRWQFSTGLPTSELALPEALPGYSSAWVGKWHLAHPSAEGEGPLHPNHTGFSYFAGSLFNLVHGPQGTDYDYFEWQKTVNGVTTVTTTYATTDTADEAILATRRLAEPWLVVASFNAPHDPRHTPPADLLTCEPSTPDVEARMARQMVNALDTELGRLLDRLDDDVFIVFLGDNGTSGEAILPPFDPTHGKGTMYEGGVGIPLIVAGPGVEHGECDQLVSSTDLFATLVELVGNEVPAEDSVSFLPYLRGDMTPRRSTIYAERFSPNGYDTDFEEHHRAIRNQRYKLIVSTEGPDEFYDLEVDPDEQENLIGQLTARERRAYRALLALMP